MLSPTTLLPALPWAVPLLSLFRLSRRQPSLNDVAPVSGRRLSVIIPARNEAGQIERVVRSLLASAYSPLEVIVVDDRSTDDTAATVRRIAPGDARLKLLEGQELPLGWYGKPWACWQGAQAAQGELLLFTDADTWHAPELAGRAIAMLDREQADLLTVSSKQVILTFWERVVMPQVWVLLGIRYHPELVSRATRPRDVVANGQFMLFTRESYQRIGTHQAVQGEVVEDLALAQRTVRLGARLRFVFAERFMETRMYQNLRQLVEGWSKNLYLGGRLSFPDEPFRRAVAPLLLVGAMLFWLLPLVIAGLGLLGIASGWLGPAAIAVGLSVLFWAAISRGMDAPAWYGLLYPLGALMVLFILLRSTARGARKVEWRGRIYNEETATVREITPSRKVRI